MLSVAREQAASLFATRDPIFLLQPLNEYNFRPFGCSQGQRGQRADKTVRKTKGIDTQRAEDAAASISATAALVRDGGGGTLQNPLCSRDLAVHRPTDE